MIMGLKEPICASQTSHGRSPGHHNDMPDYKPMQVGLLYLRSQPSRIVSHTGEDTIGVCIRAQHATEVEIGDLHPPVLVHQQVGGLQIPVQN